MSKALTSHPLLPVLLPQVTTHHIPRDMSGLVDGGANADRDKFQTPTVKAEEGEE